MNYPIPEPGKNWVRISNPVKKTVLTFVREDGSPPPPPPPFLRPKHFVGRSVHTFMPDVVLMLTVRTPKGADPSTQSLHAARLIEAASEWERMFGGGGLEFDPYGSRDENGEMKLRLVARNPGGAEERLHAVVKHFSALKQRAAETGPTPPPADLLAAIDRTLKTGVENLEAAEVLAG